MRPQNLFKTLFSDSTISEKDTFNINNFLTTIPN